MEDYKVCGYSAIGKSHEDKGIKCQDSCSYEQGDGFIVAAVADGLSSSKHSDIASRMAVENSVMYCVKHIRRYDEPETILATIRKAFDDSWFKIKQESYSSPNDYDTTLTLVVFVNGNVFYGQIGDSGVIALREDGKFERVTEAQNGEGVGKDRPVYPLAAKSQWIFKEYPQRTKALFLATDGVLKIIEPPLLEKQKYTLNHKYLSYIYNNLDSKKNDDELDSWIELETIRMSPEEVDFDDKTLVFISSNKGYLSKQSTEYYAYPSKELWDSLIKKYRESLYPSIESPLDTPLSETEVLPSSKTRNIDHTEPMPQIKKSKQTKSSKTKTVSIIITITIIIEIIIVIIVLLLLWIKISERPTFSNSKSIKQESLYPSIESPLDTPLSETEVVPSGKTRNIDHAEPVPQIEYFNQIKPQDKNSP